MQPSSPSIQPEPSKDRITIQVDSVSEDFIKITEAQGLKPIPIAQDILGKESAELVFIKLKDKTIAYNKSDIQLTVFRQAIFHTEIDAKTFESSKDYLKEQKRAFLVAFAKAELPELDRSNLDKWLPIAQKYANLKPSDPEYENLYSSFLMYAHDAHITTQPDFEQNFKISEKDIKLLFTDLAIHSVGPKTISTTLDPKNVTLKSLGIAISANTPFSTTVEPYDKKAEDAILHNKSRHHIPTQVVTHEIYQKAIENSKLSPDSIQAIIKKTDAEKEKFQKAVANIPRTLVPTSTPDLKDLRHRVAHINGDLFIAKSGLEGHSATFLMPYLKEVLGKKLAELQEKSKTLTQSSDKEKNDKAIKQLNHVFQGISKGVTINQLDNVSKNDPTASDYQLLVAATIASIKSLKVGESMITRGGWTSLGIGHAMYYEVTRKENNEFGLRVFNTGAGLQYHNSIRSFEPDAPGRDPKLIEKHLPFIEYTGISLESMTDESFWTAVNELNHCRIINTELGPKKTEFNATHIYESLLPFLKGTQVAASDKNADNYIVKQNSGICAWAGLNAILHTYLPKAEFLHLEHEIQVASILELYNSFSDLNTLAKDETTQLLLKKSAEQLASFSIKRANDKTISQEEWDQANDLVEFIKTHVQGSAHIAKQLAIDNAPKVNFNATDRTPYSAIRAIQLEQAPVENSEAITTSWNDKWLPKPKTITQDLNQLLVQYRNSPEPIAVAHCLRELFTALPIPSNLNDPFWSQIPPTQIEECMSTIVMLSELMQKLTGENVLDSYPERRMDFIKSFYKGQAIIHKLATQDKEMQSLGMPKWNFISKEIEQCFFSPETSKTGNTQNYDKETTAQLKAIHDYFKSQETVYEKFFDFDAYTRGGEQVDTQASNTDTESALIASYYKLNAKALQALPQMEYMEKASGDDKQIQEKKMKVLLSDFRGDIMPKKYCLMKKMSALTYLYMRQKSLKTVEGGKVKQTAKEPIVDWNARARYADGDSLAQPLHAADTTYRDFAPFKKQYGDEAWHHKDEYVQIKSLSNTLAMPLDYKDIYADKVQTDLSGLPPSTLIELRSLWATPIQEGGRLAQELQIPKLLDYFKLNLNKLDHYDFQRFFNRVLFDRDQLITLVTKNPEYLNQIASFLQTGFAYFRERSNMKGATFMVQVQQMMLDRLGKLDNKELAEELSNLKLLDLDQGKNGEACLLDLLKEDVSISDKSLVYRQLLFGYSLEWPNWSEDKRKSQLPTIVKYIALRDSNPEYIAYRDSYLSNAISNLDSKAAPYLDAAINASKSNQRGKINQLTQIVMSIADSSGLINPQTKIDWANIKWENKSPPICTGSIDGKPVLLFDSISFALTIKGEGVGLLPNRILEHPDFVHNFPGIKEQKAIPIKLNEYSFKDKKNNEIIVKYDSNTGALIIDREFIPFGPRYRLMNKGAIESVGINEALLVNQSIWVAKYAEPPTILLCSPETSKINFRIQPHDKGSYNIYREDNPHVMLLNNDSPSYSHLSDFESRLHTQIWTDRDSTNPTPKLIEMPRLSLTFNVQNDKATCNQVTGYHIAEKQIIPGLANFKTYLVLQKIENGKTLTKVIIPRKDIRALFKKGGLHTGFALSNDFPPGPSKYPPYYEYSLNAKGELETPHEGGNIYLAFILLGQGRYEDAHTYLQERSHKLKRYAKREIEMFSWISNLISIGDNDPKLNAVYLKAFAMQKNNQQIHGTTQKLATGALYDQYTNYLSLQNSMGKLLLSTSDEILILKTLIKEKPADPFLLQRLATLENVFSTGLLLPSKSQVTHQKTYSLGKADYFFSNALNGFLPDKHDKMPEVDGQADLILYPDAIKGNKFTYFKELYNLAKNVPADKVAELQKRFELKSVYSASKQLYAFLIAVAADRTGKLYPDWEGLVKMIEGRYSYNSFNSLMDASSKMYNAYVDAALSGQAKDKASSIQAGHEKVSKESQGDIKKEKAADSQLDIKEMAAAPAIRPAKKPIVIETLPQSTPVEIPHSLRTNPELVKTLFSVTDRDASRKEESSAAKLLKEMEQKQMPPRCRLEEIERKKFTDNIQDYADIEASTKVTTLLGSNNRIILQANVKKASEKVSAKLNETAQKIVSLHDRIIDLANRIPTENLTAAQRAQNAKHTGELLSGQKEPFSINELAVKFLSDNMTQFFDRNPNLTKADIADLRSMVSTFLMLKTEEQAARRQIQALNNIATYVKKFPARGSLENDPTFKELSDKAFQELSCTREYNPLTQYHLLVFEAMTEMALRKDQVDNIEKMTKAPHLILQMIMGAGKSTVLLPILALNQADGVNLPIVILPPQLYASTMQHMRKNLGGAFKRAIQPLPFDRQTECSVEYLQNTLNYLKSIINNRECLMMDSKSIHCLGLKFKEAMIDFSNNPNDPVLRQQADLMRQILKLFKDNGRAIIDEADLVLNVRTEVNFTIGKTVRLEKTRCEAIGNLCSYLCDPQIIKMCGKNPLEGGVSLSPDVYNNVKLTLINKVVSAATKNSHDPLNKFITTLNTAQRTHLNNYLKGERGSAAETFIENIKDAAVKDLLALIKEELNNILPLTISKRYCVDYGPSLKKTGEGQLLAIPYNGNNSPVEASEFRSPDILMNYTAQTLWKTGIPQSEISRYVENLKIEAAKEKLTKGLSSENDTAAYMAFQSLLGKGLENIKFYTCTSDDCQRIADSLNASRKDDPSTFFNYISQCVFPQIKLSESQLTSNAIDLPGMFKTAVGFTGTPWNAPSYEENLFAKTEPAKGVDGKTAVLLYEKVSQAKDGIRTLKTLPPTTDKSKPSFTVALTDLIRPNDDALIDTGAVFNGQSNGVVANEILKLLQSRASSMKGVVYYRNNKAVVLELRADGVPHTVPFDQSTLKPEERFTYYDQPHTTGTDIPQHRYAKATLTISKEMTTRDLFQGAWRFRGLDKQQSVSFAMIGVAEERIRKSCNIPDNSPIKYAHILQYTKAQQAEQQIEHLKTAMKPKIENIPKREVYNALLNTDLGEKGSPDAAQLIQQLHPILVSTPSTSPFALYGKQDTLLTREDIVKDMQDTAMRKIKNVSPALLPFTNLEAGFKGLQTTLGLLPNKMLSTTGNSADASVEKEQEKETEKERELQLETNVQIYHANQFNSKRHQRWAVENHPPEIFSKHSFPPFERQPYEIAAQLTNLSTFYGNEAHQIFDFGGPLLDGMMGNANRLSIKNHDHGNILSHKQLPTDYVLFVREKGKKEASMRMVLLDSPSDLACYWTALSDARLKKHYTEPREMELCICNLNGDVIQHDGSIDFNDRRSPFVNSLREEGLSLRVRAKLALGELFYSPSELEVVKSYIKKYGKAQLEKYYKDIILKSDPQKQKLFEQTPLFFIFGKPDWSKTLMKETAAKQKEEADVKAKST